MGIIMQPTRALSQQVFSRASNFCTARFATGLRRVNPAYNSDNKSTASHRQSADSRSALTQCRSYATATVTATVKTPRKPKAHTGRTTTTKKKTASTTATKKKPTAKEAKSAAKPKPKPKRRAKAKSKPKPKLRKRILTEKQTAAKAKTIAVKKQQHLRATALLTAPKGLPASAWQVLIAEESRGKTGIKVASNAKEASSKYHSLAPEARERLNHTAVENKAKNESAHKKWLLSFTPKQVKEANNARLALNRQFKTEGSKKHISRLVDERLVKRPTTSYAYFLSERNASGDMNGMKIGEIGGLVAREWKALSASSKKTYEDMGDADRKRYILEHKTAYGEDAYVVRRPRAATAA